MHLSANEARIPRKGDFIWDPGYWTGSRMVRYRSGGSLADPTAIFREEIVAKGKIVYENIR